MRWGKIHGPGDSRVYDGPVGLSEEEREKAEEELSACLEGALWKRKWLILGSHKAHF